MDGMYMINGCISLHDFASADNGCFSLWGGLKAAFCTLLSPPVHSELVKQSFVTLNILSPPLYSLGKKELASRSLFESFESSERGRAWTRNCCRARMMSWAFENKLSVLTQGFYFFGSGVGHRNTPEFLVSEK